jgi:CheY-like chemotaxis protein
MAHVLVIDDDAPVLSTLKGMLERAGHRVTPAENGRIGLQAFKHDPADLVITDILMPECEGLETITALRRLDWQVAIVVMSGGGASTRGSTEREGPDYLQLAQGLGAWATLRKPFRSEQLLQSVDFCLARRIESCGSPSRR